MEVPFALSIHKFVNSVGADAGFAAFICVAVIGLLYFAQARETATLRDRLEDAHERIGGLESRISQLLHLQSTRQAVPQPPAPGRVTPPPVGSRPTGSAIPSVRRVPAATAAGSAVPQASAAFPFAPVGMAAPALASATKLIPDPVAPPVLPAVSAPSTVPAPAAAPATSPVPGAGLPGDTVVVPGGAVAVGDGKSETPGATAGIAPRAIAGAAPPRVQIRADGAGSAPTPRRSVTAARPVGEARFDVFEKDRGGSRSRLGSRRLPLAIGVVAVVVIIGGLIAITQSGSGTSNPTAGQGSGTGAAAKSSSGSHNGSKHKSVPFSASKVTVAVLNGTAVGGLAADVAKVLSGAGYKRGSVTNAASQAQRVTIVYFMPGAKTDAEHVAGRLKLKRSSIKAATHAAIHSCATSATTSATTSCRGNVIVSVGRDRASLASASSSAG
jgi:hypothetical protein